MEENRYNLTHSCPQVDEAIGRALPGGAIDLSLSNKANQADVDASLSNNAADHPHRNLLDNWDFRNPVNQRAVTAGTVDWGTYFLDRWLGQCTYTINTGSLSLAAGSYIVQKHEIAPIFPCTLSVLLANGTIFASKFTETGGKHISGYGVFDIEDTFIAINNTNSVEIKAVKLELGPVSTLANDPPADFGEELRKCQRYYFQRHFMQYETIAAGYLGAEWLNLVLGIGSPMHTNTPTLSVSGALALVGAAASEALTPVNAACSGCAANLGFSTTASTQGACYAYSPDAGGATISLSADL